MVLAQLQKQEHQRTGQRSPPDHFLVGGSLGTGLEMRLERGVNDLYGIDELITCIYFNL